MNVSPALRRLLLHLRTKCTAECCQARAFELDDARVESWFRSEPANRFEEIQHAVAVASSAVPVQKKVHLEARGLESTWDAEELSSFLAELSAALQRRTP